VQDIEGQPIPDKIIEIPGILVWKLTKVVDLESESA
jgi:hypothetical protein